MRVGVLLAVTLASASLVFAQEAQQRLPEVESVYAPPEPPRENEGANEGGVKLNLNAGLLTDYIFRGIDRSESGGSEDSPNLQIDTNLSFDLGKWPHPFIGVFVNIYDSDAQSRFQEIRPYFGLDWNLRPFLFTFGNNSYIYPDRDHFNTSEIFGKVLLDDSYFFRTDKPVFNAYLFGAYDYDKYHGFYLEFGMSHDFVIEDTPIMLTPVGQIAYVNDFQMFRPVLGATADPAFDFNPLGPSATGFQHYQVGLIMTYALNETFNIPRRYGVFDLKAYLMYTDGIDHKLRADTEIWGGVGIAFSY
jgi:hypothetical protein